MRSEGRVEPYANFVEKGRLTQHALWAFLGGYNFARQAPPNAEKMS